MALLSIETESFAGGLTGSQQPHKQNAKARQHARHLYVLLLHRFIQQQESHLRAFRLRRMLNLQI